MLFAIALAVPDWSVAVMWAMAAGVAVGVAQRALWARPAPRGVVSRDARTRLIVAGAWLALIGGAAAWALTSGRGPAEAATDLVDAIQGSAWGPLAFVARLPGAPPDLLLGGRPHRRRRLPLRSRRAASSSW